MTQLATTAAGFAETGIARPLVHEVYVRKAIGSVAPGDTPGSLGAPPEAGAPGSDSAVPFVYSPDLRCAQLRLRLGGDPGSARFTLGDTAAASGVASIHRLERLAAMVAPDDEVRVVVYPAHDDALDEQDVAGRLVFEGVVDHAGFNLARQGDDEDESMTFSASAWPAEDNRDDAHRVDHRLMPAAADTPDPDGEAVVLDGAQVARVEALSMPAVFNPGGRGNRHPTARFSGAGLSAASGGAVQLDPSLWTYDGDPSGGAWTVADALSSLIGAYLYGVAESGAPDSGALVRRVGIDPDLGLALEAAQAGGPPEAVSETFRGLDRVLPPTPVQGLGVFEACARVARAGDFDLVLTPSGLAPSDKAPDRAYALTVLRRGAGTVKPLRFPRPESLAAGSASGGGASGVSGGYDLPGVRGVRDASRCVTRVRTRAPQFYEVTLELKPLWKPDEVAAAAVDATLTVPAEEGRASADADVAEYYDRHVPGGDAFAQHGHVGRVWGLDCTGALSRAGFGYPPGSPGEFVHDYALAPAGFDFAAALGLDVANPVADDRPDDVRPELVFVSRPRPARPLVRASAARAGVRYVLEVTGTPDAGGWRVLSPGPLTVAPAPGIGVGSAGASGDSGGEFAVRIGGRGLANLARASVGSLLGGAEPRADRSWWQAIQPDTRTLGLRLTCLIEGDSALVRSAGPTAAAGVRRARSRYAAVRSPDVWVAPGSHFAPSALEWARLPDDEAAGAGVLLPADAQAVADAARDRFEGATVSLAMTSWRLLRSWWSLGSVIRGIEGRPGLANWFTPGYQASQSTSSGSASGGSGGAFVYGVTLRLWPENQQQLDLDVTDARLRRGAP